MANNEQSYTEIPSSINPDIYKKTSEELDHIDEDELDVAGGFIESKGKKLEEIPEYIKNNEFFLGVYSHGVNEAIGELYIARDVEDVNVPDELWDLARQRESEVREAIQAVREKTEKLIDVTESNRMDHLDRKIDKDMYEVVDRFIDAKGNPILEKEARKSLDNFVMDYAKAYSDHDFQGEKAGWINPTLMRNHVLQQVEKAREQVAAEKKPLSALFTPEEKASLKATHDQGRALGKGQEIEH